MRHGSLFSGIGGFDLAAAWLGWHNVFQVAIDPFCRRVLARHFPDTYRHGDIRTFPAEQFTGQIDIITGGFPCQPFSAAGNQRGQDDPRYLWPEMLRVIRIIRPRHVLGENVSGFVGHLDQACGGLEREGYAVEPYMVPASAFGAPHH